jgi:hypothetical protein
MLRLSSILRLRSQNSYMSQVSRLRIQGPNSSIKMEKVARAFQIKPDGKVLGTGAGAKPSRDQEGEFAAWILRLKMSTFVHIRCVPVFLHSLKAPTQNTSELMEPIRPAGFTMSSAREWIKGTLSKNTSFG